MDICNESALRLVRPALLPQPQAVEFCGSMNLSGLVLSHEAEGGMLQEIERLDQHLGDRKADATTLSLSLRICESPLELSDIACRPGGYELTIAGDSKRLTVEIKGYDEAGVRYGLITLRQCLVRANGGWRVPLGKIDDGPDLQERGVFCTVGNAGNAGDAVLMRQIDCLVDYKINAIDLACGVKRKLPIKSIICPELSGETEAFARVLAHAHKRGLKTVVYIPHLEQMGGLRKAVPEIGAQNGVGNTSGLCLSHPRTREVLVGIACEIIEQHDFDELSVWVSESYLGQCCCEACAAREPFDIEMEFLAGFFSDIQERFPEQRCRYLTTARSTQLNSILAHLMGKDRVMEFFGGDVKVSTYKVVQSDFLTPAIRRLAAEGFKVSVVPGFHWGAGWGIPVPFVGHIQWKTGEIAAAGLNGFMGWTGMRLASADINIAAAADIGWNARGRPAVDMLEDYARLHGQAHPDKMARIWRDLGACAEYGLDHNLRYGFGPHSRIRAGLMRMIERDDVDGLDRQATFDLWERIEKWQPAMEKSREAFAMSQEFAEEPLCTEMRVVHLMNEIMFAATWMYFVWAREKDPDVYKGPWRDCRQEWTRCLAAIRTSHDQLCQDWPTLRDKFFTSARPPFDDIIEICDRVEERLLGR